MFSTTGFVLSHDAGVPPPSRRTEPFFHEFGAFSPTPTDLAPLDASSRGRWVGTEHIQQLDVEGLERWVEVGVAADVAFGAGERIDRHT